jgi:hypothetical protein
VAYIELHEHVFRHPKTYRVARALGLGRFQTVGHLAALWCWALECAPGGLIPLEDAEAAAGEAGWTGDADTFWGALIAAGYVETCDLGYSLHDWGEYGGKLQATRATDRERKRQQRDGGRPAEPPATPEAPPRGHCSAADGTGAGHPTDGARTSDGHPTDGARTAQVEKRSVAELLRDGDPPSPPPAAGGEPLALAAPDVGEATGRGGRREAVTAHLEAEFEAWWALYPRRIDRKGALGLYVHWRTVGGKTREELLTAVRAYAEECRLNDRAPEVIKHATTFLAKGHDFVADYQAGPVSVPPGTGRARASPVGGHPGLGRGVRDPRFAIVEEQWRRDREAGLMDAGGDT